MQAMELEDQLRHSLKNYDVDVLKGRDYVQVRPHDVNKGVFVTQVLELLHRTCNARIDFVMCVGDDTTDEAMWGRRALVKRRFKAAAQYKENYPHVTAVELVRAFHG